MINLPLKIELKDAVEIKNKTYKELVIGRFPTMEYFSELECPVSGASIKQGDLYAAIAYCCDVPIFMIEKISYRDFKIIIDAFLSLMFEISDDEKPIIEEDENPTSLPKSIELSHPIHYGVVDLKELVFKRQLTAGALKNVGILASTCKQGDLFAAVACMVDQPVKVIKQLGFIDYQKAVGVVNNFL